jgi:hypothetical protein
MILVSNALLQRWCHAAQFLEPLCDTVANFLLVWRVAARQEAIPSGELLQACHFNLIDGWEIWGLRHSKSPINKRHYYINLTVLNWFLVHQRGKIFELFAFCFDCVYEAGRTACCPARRRDFTTALVSPGVTSFQV